MDADYKTRDTRRSVASLCYKELRPDAMCLSIAVDRPDHVLSKGEHEGFEFVTVHNGSGYRCGYVRVPVGHPWHGKDYGDIEPYPEVHGGLTFAAPDKPCDGDRPDDAWWIGFDCAHCDDAPDPSLPGYKDYGISLREYGVIRTTEYVEAECRSLCEQAKAAVAAQRPRSPGRRQ